MHIPTKVASFTPLVSFLFQACSRGQSWVRISTSLVHFHPMVRQARCSRFTVLEPNTLSWGRTHEPLEGGVTMVTLELQCRTPTNPMATAFRESGLFCLQWQRRKRLLKTCVRTRKGDGYHNPQQSQDDAVLTAEELPTLTIAITHASGTSCRSSNGIRND